MILNTFFQSENNSHLICPDRKGRWGDAKKLRKSVVDNYGKYYDIQHVDLNNDGRKDILTTTLK